MQHCTFCKLWNPAILDWRTWRKFGEHGKHGKDGKHQPCELKHSIHDSKHSFCQPDDSKHSFLHHLSRKLKNDFVSLFNCTRDQSTRTHTLKIREHSCFGMLCKIPAAPHIYGAVHKWSSLNGDEVVVVVVVRAGPGGGLLQSQLFFLNWNKVCLVSVSCEYALTFCAACFSVRYPLLQVRSHSSKYSTHSYIYLHRYPQIRGRGAYMPPTPPGQIGLRVMNDNHYKRRYNWKYGGSWGSHILGYQKLTILWPFGENLVTIW